MHLLSRQTPPIGEVIPVTYPRQLSQVQCCLQDTGAPSVTGWTCCDTIWAETEAIREKIKKNLSDKTQPYRCIAELSWPTISEPGFHVRQYQCLILRLTKLRMQSYLASHPPPPTQLMGISAVTWPRSPSSILTRINIYSNDFTNGNPQKKIVSYKYLYVKVGNKTKIWACKTFLLRTCSNYKYYIQVLCVQDVVSLISLINQCLQTVMQLCGDALFVLSVEHCGSF